MNKQQLANKIWESANKMRSKIEANEYKDYILGFIFYKYLSDTEVKFLMAMGYSHDDLKKEVHEINADIVTYCQDKLGYFIAYENLYSTWLDKGRDFDVSNVTDALSAFSRLIGKRHRKVYENIFQTLETGLSKLGDTSGARTKAISNLLELIRDIPMDGKQDYDVLGFIYEYLISRFAANAGKKAGEFYTPYEVSLLMSQIIAHHLKDRQEIEIYDPTSGSGSLLINIGKSVAKYMPNDDNIKYYAQELKENTYNLTRMNLIMRGIKPDNIFARNGDTLEEDWPLFDENDPIGTYTPLYVDAVVSNPPYSQNWDPTDKENQPRYKDYGLAPKGKADYAFLLHDLYHIKPDGMMAIVLPHGVLFRGGEEGAIRKNLIERNNIDAIIGLPANIFYGTGIPTIIMVLRQKRPHTDILMIDASKGFAKEGKNNKLRASDIKRIVDTVIRRQNVDKFSRVISREEIRANDYNLNIPRYVDASEKAESWDIYASMFGDIPYSEINALADYWQAFPTLRQDLFHEVNSGYARLTDKDLKDTIHQHPDVLAFQAAFQEAFADFEQHLTTALIDQMATVPLASQEDALADDIFHRLSALPLIDPYEAYQRLDDCWIDIAGDLEIIQSESFDAIRRVDPHMVLKKKDGKDQEVQDGWKGRIIPFELAQKTLLNKDYTALTAITQRLTAIPDAYASALEELSEEQKESAILNEANDAFVLKEVEKKLKEMKKSLLSEEDQALYTILEEVHHLSQEEKALKKQLKADTLALTEATKNAIETLSDHDAQQLLKAKWIDEMMADLYRLPHSIIDHLINQVTALSKKYAVTYAEVQADIQKTEQTLCAMLDDLVGNEFDIKGIREFQSLLMGDSYGQ